MSHIWVMHVTHVSHVTHMSHVNIAARKEPIIHCITDMYSHVTHTSHACHTCESCHTYQHARVRTTAVFVTHNQLHYDVWVSHVTYVCESCHTCEWVMSYMWVSHVTYASESCHICEWVMSHMQVSHVTYVSESWHKRASTRTCSRRQEEEEISPFETRFECLPLPEFQAAFWAQSLIFYLSETNKLRPKAMSLLLDGESASQSLKSASRSQNLFSRAMNLLPGARIWLKEPQSCFQEEENALRAMNPACWRKDMLTRAMQLGSSCLPDMNLLPGGKMRIHEPWTDCRKKLFCE